MAGGKNTKLNLSYFRYLLRRQGSLEETIMLGELEGRKERGRPNMGWTALIQNHRHESTGAELGCGRQNMVSITHSEGYHRSQPLCDPVLNSMAYNTQFFKMIDVGKYRWYRGWMTRWLESG